MHFYGLRLEEVENMDNASVESLWECITIIEAQEQLKRFEVQDWGHMKKATREKRHKQLFAQAYPGEMKPKNYVSPEHLQKMLGGLHG